MKIKTINVVESSGYDTPTIHSFSPDEEGKQQAKELFCKIAREQDGYFDEDEIEIGWNKTFLSDENGTWSLDFIISEI